MCGVGASLLRGARAASPRLGVVLVPFTLAGLFVGRRGAGRLDGPGLRPAVLGVAGLAGLFALARGVF